MPRRDGGRARAALTSLPAATPGSGNGPGGNATYLDDLERELEAWNERLSRASDLPRKASRQARSAHRKRILVSKVRHRNLERRLADMRTFPARFLALRPGLLLLWSLFTSGVEEAES